MNTEGNDDLKGTTFLCDEDEGGNESNKPVKKISADNRAGVAIAADMRIAPKE